MVMAVLACISYGQRGICADLQNNYIGFYNEK